MVSIVIPAFQAEARIPRALDGVRAQTFADWEVLVFEDGSSDGTAGIVSDFARRCTQRVKYSNSGVNRGVSATRNAAIREARGEVVAFLDADDWWTSEHLASGLRALEMGAGFSYSSFNLYDERLRKVVRTVEPTVRQLTQPMVCMFEANFIQSSSLVVIKREVIEAVGTFDENLRISEDSDLWMRALAAKYRLSHTGVLTSTYSKHNSSAMSASSTVADHLVKFYSKHVTSEFLPLSLRRGKLAEALINSGRLKYRSEPREACKLFLSAWRLRPQLIKAACYATISAILMLGRGAAKSPEDSKRPLKGSSAA